MSGVTHLGVIIAVMVTMVISTEGLSLSPRIVGGTAITDRCRAPFNSMVALQFDADVAPITICSAVMVTDTYLVTTAKCLLVIAEQAARANDPKRAVAVLGELDTVMRGEEGEQRIDFKSFKVNFGYNRTSQADNIGIIELARPAKLGRCVRPAAMIEKDPKACLDIDDSCQVVGWGSYTESKNPISSRSARTAAVSVYSDTITYLLSSSDNYVAPRGVLYADNLNPFQKTCFYDWGDLVSCKRNGNNILRGIVSEHNCNSKVSYPFTIIDISLYQTWIENCVKQWSTCAAIGY